MVRKAVLTIDVDCLHSHVQRSGGRRRLLGRHSAHIQLSYRYWLPRYLDLLASYGVVGTFFLVADFARDPACRDTLRRMVAEGHEVASHSLTHRLQLCEDTPALKRRELAESRKILQDLTGQPIAGFRGPGYAMDPELAEMLLECGYGYDSSVVPGQLFWGYKRLLHTFDRLFHGAMSAYPSRIRRARGGLYTLHEKDGGAGIMELPINVTPGVGFPFVSFVIRSRRRFEGMHRAIRAREDTVLYQFHDFEFMDHANPLEAVWTLVTRRDGKHPLPERMQLFGHVIQALQADAQIVTGAQLLEIFADREDFKG